MGKHDKELTEQEVYNPIYHQGRLTVLLSKGHWERLQSIAKHQKKSINLVLVGWIETYNLNPPVKHGAID